MPVWHRTRSSERGIKLGQHLQQKAVQAAYLFLCDSSPLARHETVVLSSGSAGNPRGLNFGPVLSLWAELDVPYAYHLSSCVIFFLYVSNKLRVLTGESLKLGSMHFMMCVASCTSL